MAIKLVVLKSGEAFFYCPACKCTHGIRVSPPVDPSVSWSYNDDPEFPTTEPSIRVMSGVDASSTTCHCYLVAGHIRFCEDSPHELAGQTVPLPDFPRTIHFTGYTWPEGADAPLEDTHESCSETD